MRLQSRSIETGLQFAGHRQEAADESLRMRQHGRSAPTWSDAMIRLNQQIRLTRREVERFVKITDLVPEHIHTFEDFDAYVARCKAHYWGVSKDTRFMHWLIDRERDRCCGTVVSCSLVP
jgi:hypothetical protein